MGWDMKDYEPVEDRIRAFYSDHSDGRILTEIEHHNEDFSFVLFKASAFIGESDSPVATGHAYEKASDRGVNATSHIENCETSAIGRALANLGYGAKGKRPSREEMRKVVQNSETAADAGALPSSAQATSVPAAVSDQSQKPESAVDGEVAVPPASESWRVIERAVEQGQVKSTKVHMHAAALCTEKGEAIPQKYLDVAQCTPEILHGIATHFGLAVAA
jgi:hypothetical protein